MKAVILDVRNYYIWSVVILFCSCLSQKDFIIDSDYNYNGKFKKYKTYSFMSNPENDTLFHREILEQTISSRMGAQGYSKVKIKPDILVMYKIFYDDFSLRGYNQPHFESWVNDGISKGKDDEDDESDEFLDEDIPEGADYNVNNYSMSEGTLLVIFFDRKKKETVWQGYASGVFSKDDSSAKKNIKIATSKIFNEFRLIADGYVIKG